ncbi:urease accessory protein UreD [Cytophaga hutchinsonii]|uniref:Urease accessory protein UreD n=1 Tax=Cytophaga hutchinsonii (strain ATCC 33406 / DSM 1761 / CIP 103989 / NBRC 15051 / NCIMB 9469 / D465) TaxID=269798 RepID=URED_CYTH3|nr:urease accessory protein UreD [Cytophaga hutchinsonii]Q11VN0.1 RecName: Full=Urease accessory protein UreD [Cytophaga hutchinsonii ATCC 33406]ABG58536.1 urease accessory protein [Cytophaga hutchinsonii ATCC 33406]SFX76468.1 urease accessory protein [Cytophaga hutchinsonii ATCC 33406]
MVKDTTHSILEISTIHGKSSVTGSKIFRPLKIFALEKNKACHLVFSNYGGGFVEGDSIDLTIDCKADTVSAFSSQANTRIYRSEHGKTCKQTITGTVGENALVVFMGDPVVPHQKSIFEQHLFWKLEKNAVLLVIDWFEAGRILNGERFAFDSFFTELKIESNGVPIVWDRFKMDPSQNNMNSPGAFLDHSSYINIFLAGDENLTRVKSIETQLRFLAAQYFHEHIENKSESLIRIGSAVKVNEQVFMIRCSAKNNDLLQPFVKALAEHMSDKELLGFNPFEGRN